MEDRMEGRYWCYMCSQVVNPRVEPDIKCPFCETGFLEEMPNGRHYSNNNNATDLGSPNNPSLWAPILLGLIGGTSSALRMLQATRNVAADTSDNSRESSGGMILFDPFDIAALIAQGSFGPTAGASGSSGGYLMGTELDLFLQHLAEIDRNRYGTAPTQKEAVEAMPSVTVREIVQCSICLEDIEIGSEAKEMPCKHKFHCDCIVPWLELHSSCPVCRYQMPSDDSKTEAIGTEGRTTSTNDAQTDRSRLGIGRRY